VYVVERTHPWKQDLDWLPRRARTLRWMVTGSIWGGTAAAVVAFMAAAPAVAAALSKVIAITGVGAAIAGERAGYAAYQKQVRALTRDIDLAALRDLGDGEVVRVKGKVRADESLTGILHDTPGVFRRLVLEAGGRWVHEAAVDFTLVDDHGKHIFVHAAAARLLVATQELLDYPATRFRSHGSARVAALVGGRGVVKAREWVLSDGAEVEVIGVKTMTADPEGASAGYREPPQRPTLRSSKELPLLISPLAFR
jgi:hypothetical protein